MKTAYENYCVVRDKMGYTDYKVAKETGIGTATMSNWKNGKYVPKSDKIQKIATLLNTTEKFIMDGEDEEHSNGYYLNDETAEMAQKLFENKDLRVLFDAAKDASPEDLKTTYDMLMALKKKERGMDAD